MSAATSSRTSTRLAPGRRRLTPDDTFHRIDPTLSLHDEPTLHSATGGLADDADRLSDFARQVIEREAEGAGSADEHVDDGLFHPAEIGDMAAAVLAGVGSAGGSPSDRGVKGQGMDSSSFEARPLPSTSTNRASGGGSGGSGMGGSGSNGLDRNPVTSTQRTRSHSGNAQEDELVPDDEEDELEESPVGNPGPRRGRKRKYALPLGPGETRDPIQMKKDSHVRSKHPFPAAPKGTLKADKAERGGASTARSNKRRYMRYTTAHPGPERQSRQGKYTPFSCRVHRGPAEAAGRQCIRTKDGRDGDEWHEHGQRST